jgi:myo-inositol-1(or 4)-monophosphatase
VSLRGSDRADPYAIELSAAIEIAERAGRLIVERADRIEQIDYKDARDVVTDVDRRSEELILGELRRRFPGDAQLAEESGARGSAPRTWVVDPLDGTVNYANRIPIYCVSIALVEGDRPVLGVVHDPVRGETFSATTDSPARLNGRPVEASSKPRLADFVIALTLDRVRAASRSPALSEAIRVQRRLGSSALALAWVGCGRFDAFIQTENLSAWDVAAAGLIAERGGAQVRRLDGGPYLDPALGPGRYGVIAAPEAHFEELRRLVG